MYLSPQVPLPYQCEMIFLQKVYEYINANIPNIIEGDFNTIEKSQINTYLPKFNTIKSKEFNHLCLIIGLSNLLEPSVTKQKCATEIVAQ